MINERNLGIMGRFSPNIDKIEIPRPYPIRMGIERNDK
jgi:hypothetical protein